MRRILAITALLAACGPGTAPQQDNPAALVFPDEDGDGIMDHHEGGPEDDADGDGIPNYLDLDSDGDGIPDSVEAGDDDLFTMPFDTDGDGIPDFLDLDSDGNCIPDAQEGGGDLDGDGVEDFRDLDDDGDGILDTVEIGPDCEIRDSDEDGTPDYKDIDSDGDGIGDIFEGGTSPYNPVPRDTDGDGIPDYLDLDSDDDTMSDEFESGGGGPLVEPRDTDGDGVPDFRDPDADGDGLSDLDELLLHNTDPFKADTDGDGFSDGAEIAAGVDPLDPNSIIEGLYVTVPEREDVQEIFLFELSIKQADIGFILDTTGSMGSLLNAMAGEFATLVTEITATIPDAQYGVGSFADYNYGGFGSGSDRPFVLRRQITDSQSQVQSALSALSPAGGADLPESSIEALYQALTGAGYDQTCNGNYDAGTDVPPFIAHPGDVFGGAVTGSYDASSPGGGTGGGMGFRDYALPVLVYATDAVLRDPLDGYGVPPNACKNANRNDVTAAAAARGAYLIGVSVGGNSAINQMNTLADLTGSHDAFGNRLVYSWSSGNAGFRSTVVNAIDQLVGGIQFSEITLQVEGDDTGMVVGIQPQVYYPTGAVNGDIVNFTLTFRGTETADQNDTLKKLTLNVIGDGTVLLDSYDIFVVVPGASL